MLYTVTDGYRNPLFLIPIRIHGILNKVCYFINILSGPKNRTYGPQALYLNSNQILVHFLIFSMDLCCL